MITAALVTTVIDGDTLEIKGGETIRLADVDAPELGTRLGQWSKTYLESRVLGKWVHIERLGQGYYGRTLAIVRIDGKSVNQEIADEQYKRGWNRA